jgi:hypothetical protein
MLSHVKEAVGQALGILQVPITLETYPCHDLVRRPRIPVDAR